MNLLKIFRRGDGTTYNGEGDGKQSISEGILFEGTNVFLQWGISIEDLSKKLQVRKERRSDRTIFHWGEQTILGGLRLDLTTIYWDNQSDEGIQRLWSIGFWSIGNKEAEKDIARISAHLDQTLGLPVKREWNAEDVSLEWRIKDIRLSLNYFERHAYKLHFQIEKI